MTQIQALYSAFDVVPSAKGAATHIEAMAQALFDHCGGGLLHVLGAPGLPAYQREGERQVIRRQIPSDNFLERALIFQEQLGDLVRRLSGLKFAQFRDPFSGAAILSGRPAACRTIYEVNGLPSIELPYAYPRVARSTLEKIAAQERWCWETADRIVVPAQTIADNMMRLGAPANRIDVVRNGADIPPPAPRPSHAPARYLIYVGGLHPWQGLPVLVQAFARLRDLDVKLVILSSHEAKKARGIQRLIRRLDIGDHVVWRYRLKRATVMQWLMHAEIAVAPLTACSRNLDQGCCPLKVLEAMAAGTAVVASDLPAVRELMTDGVQGLLAPPDRPDALSRTLRALLDYPDRCREMGQAGRAHVATQLQWTHCRATMSEVFERLEGA